MDTIIQLEWQAIEIVVKYALAVHYVDGWE